MLTPQERLKAYKWALKELYVKDADRSFICIILGRYTNYSMFLITAHFPELAQYKPDDITAHVAWFDNDEGGREWRRIVLLECVADVKKLIKYNGNYEQKG